MVVAKYQNQKQCMIVRMIVLIHVAYTIPEITFFSFMKAMCYGRAIGFGGGRIIHLLTHVIHECNLDNRLLHIDQASYDRKDERPLPPPH